MKYLLIICLLSINIALNSIPSKDEIKKEIKKDVKEKVAEEKSKKKKKNKKSSNSKNKKSHAKDQKSDNVNLGITDGKEFEPEFDLTEFRNRKEKYKYNGYVNFNSDYSLQFWIPTHIKNAKIETTVLSFAVFDLYLYKDFYRFSYETTFGGSSFKKQKDLLNRRKKKAWEKFVSEVKIPFTKKLYFSFVQEIFTGSVKTKENKIYLTEDYSSDSEDGAALEFLKGERIGFITKFQDYSLGFSDFLSFFERFGIFYTRYDKPYSLTIGEQQNSKYVFDSLFQGAGLFARIDETFSEYSFAINVKYGLGSIYLKGLDSTIESMLEHDLIHYLDLNFKLERYKTFFDDKLKLNVATDIQYRRFFILYSEEYEVEDEYGDTVTEDEFESIHLNSDFIFGFQLGLSYKF